MGLQLIQFYRIFFLFFLIIISCSKLIFTRLIKINNISAIGLHKICRGGVIIVINDRVSLVSFLDIYTPEYFQIILTFLGEISLILTAAYKK